jgi:hypothetical protein
MAYSEEPSMINEENILIRKKLNYATWTIKKPVCELQPAGLRLIQSLPQNTWKEDF